MHSIMQMFACNTCSSNYRATPLASLPLVSRLTSSRRRRRVSLSLSHSHQQHRSLQHIVSPQKRLARVKILHTHTHRLTRSSPDSTSSRDIRLSPSRRSSNKSSTRLLACESQRNKCVATAHTYVSGVSRLFSRQGYSVTYLNQMFVNPFGEGFLLNGISFVCGRARL